MTILPQNPAPGTPGAFHAQARELRAAGYAPIPLHADTKRPNIKGWSRWSHQLPTVEEVAGWCATSYWNAADLGIVGGRDCTGIDIDRDDLIRPFLQILPPTPVVKIGGKGMTAFYRSHPEDECRTRHYAGAADIIGIGGQTVIPPSIHEKTKRPYRWAAGEFWPEMPTLSLLDVPVGHLPMLPVNFYLQVESVLESLGLIKPKVERDRERAWRPSYTGQPAALPEHVRMHRARYQAAADTKLARQVETVAGMAEGGRNNALFSAAAGLARWVRFGFLNEGEVERQLVAAMVANGYADQNGFGPVHATIESGMNKGANDALPELADRDAYQPFKPAVAPVSPAQAANIVPFPGSPPAPAPASQDPFAAPVQGTLSTMLLAVPPVAPAIGLRAESAATIIRRPIKARKWAVDQWVPGDNVTLVVGDGGTGKSLLLLQLLACVATGRPFFGLDVSTGPALYISAEDEQDEIDRRVHAIHLQAPDADISRLHCISLDDYPEPAIFAYDAKGKPAITPLLAMIEAEIVRLKPKVVGLDPLADLYACDEVKRSEVRAFISALRRIARTHQCAIILLAHPSVEGMKSGRGYSGSTAWNNSVRSRLLFGKPRREEGDDAPDDDWRELSLEKSNRSKIGGRIKMKWVEGVFVQGANTDAFDEMNRQLKAEFVFMTLLHKFISQTRPVSHMARAGNYAPLLFAAEPDAMGITKKGFEKAMSILFTANKIMTESKGPPSKLVHSIVPKVV